MVAALCVLATLAGGLLTVRLTLWRAGGVLTAALFLSVLLLCSCSRLRCCCCCTTSGSYRSCCFSTRSRCYCTTCSLLVRSLLERLLI